MIQIRRKVIRLSASERSRKIKLGRKIFETIIFKVIYHTRGSRTLRWRNIGDWWVVGGMRYFEKISNRFDRIKISTGNLEEFQEFLFQTLKKVIWSGLKLNRLELNKTFDFHFVYSFETKSIARSWKLVVFSNKLLNQNFYMFIFKLQFLQAWISSTVKFVVRSHDRTSNNPWSPLFIPSLNHL